MRNKFLLVFLLLKFLLSGSAAYAADIECSATLYPEVFLERTASVVINLEIAVKNTLSTPVDAVTWVMKSGSDDLLSDDKILFTDTWVSANQKKDFFVYPSEIEVNAIEPGDTVKLRGTNWSVGHIEFMVRGGPGLDESMLEIFDSKYEMAKKKYQTVYCEILGYVKTLN